MALGERTHIDAALDLYHGGSSSSGDLDEAEAAHYRSPRAALEIEPRQLNTLGIEPRRQRPTLAVIIGGRDE
jgi:hypothetical protein